MDYTHSTNVRTSVEMYIYIEMLNLGAFLVISRSSNSPGGSPLLRYVRSKDTKEQMIIVSQENCWSDAVIELNRALKLS